MTEEVKIVNNSMTRLANKVFKRGLKSADLLNIS